MSAGMAVRVKPLGWFGMFFLVWYFSSFVLAGLKLKASKLSAWFGLTFLLLPFRKP